MTNKLKQRENYPTLVINSTDYTFGFGYRKNNALESDELFIKKFDNDLCNNLINDLDKFISKENLQKIKKLSVSICLLYTSPSPRDTAISRMPSSA